MAKILYRNKLFDEIASTSLYENEFERLILQYSDLIFPNHHLVPFKITVQNEYGSAQADLVLIEKNYSRWWVVEVELGHHSLNGHVLPQVSTLARAAYGIKEAKYLSNNNAKLDYSKLIDLFKGAQPNVVVIVNEPKPEWERALSKHDAIITIVQIFRNENNEHVFRINGDYPDPDSIATSICYLDKEMLNFLVIDSPGGLNLPENKKFKIFYDKKVTYWKRIDVTDRVWLMPLGNHPLELNKTYNLILMGDGEYSFKPLN